MKRAFYTAAVAALLLVSVSPAWAISITATLTADNHYALFYGDRDATSLTFVGHNEMVREGTEGKFNWSAAETWTFDAGDDDYLFVVAWSDDWIRQGFLGQFETPDGHFYTGTSWEYFLTNHDLDTGSPVPTSSEVSATLDGVGWSAISNVVDSTGSPWGLIAGISTHADWIWGSALIGGSAEGEYQVFRHAVPEPGTLALLASALIGAGARRRSARLG